MENPKILFLKKKFVPLLKKLKAEDKAKWGIMTAQQMVEHLADAVRNANGKLILPLVNKGEQLKKSRAFLMSDQPFKQNMENPFIPAEGLQIKKPDIQSAILKLQKELNYFFELFEKHPEIKTRNPFFGKLDYKMNVHLLNKHALHHLSQFGLV